MKKIATLFFAAVASLVVVAPGCGSQASTICGVECDCEHCSDLSEDEKCAARQRDADVADAYGCLAEWEDWATCFETEGKCDETKASYSTTEDASGSCTGKQMTGVDCSMDATICTMGMANAFCEAGQCTYKTCEGTGQPCTTNGECPNNPGKDRCSDQLTDIAKCIEDNTAHKQPTPQPGSSGGQEG